MVPSAKLPSYHTSNVSPSLVLAPLDFRRTFVLTLDTDQLLLCVHTLAEPDRNASLNRAIV